ncbi:alpha/beta hydrolase [Nodosilinea sp. AN01ver1]|uniref:alpha/beta hydrolase n=1 Tax=Nodosilinea sp. AN01ver1 TaxID=3423362 RepID=UPI003D31ED18
MTKPSKGSRLQRYGKGIAVGLASALGLIILAGAGTYAAFRLSPWPSALLIRRAFDAEAEQVSEALEPYLPKGVAAVLDERYAPGRDAYLDVYFPDSLSEGERLPTVVWSHGGAYISGDKDQIGHYAQVLAGQGFTVVSVNYSIAPGAKFPTPIRQVNQALGYLVENSDRLRVDPNRIFLAGDSAGSHISAQLAVAISEPAYAQQLGLTPAVTPDQIAGMLLYCGPYNVRSVNLSGPFGQFMTTVLWAYSGDRNFAENDYFALANLSDYVTADFPPTFISAGNADPLLPHSTALAEQLEQLGVPVETLFFPSDHEPGLGHEYQFVLASEAGQLALERSVQFMQELTAPASSPDTSPQ